MAKQSYYEIAVRKGDDAGIFEVKDPEVVKLFGEMCAIAKKLVDDGKVDEAVVVEKRPVQRFTRYLGEG